jgi:hypothetical protein
MRMFTCSTGTRSSSPSPPLVQLRAVSDKYLIIIPRMKSRSTIRPRLCRVHSSIPVPYILAARSAQGFTASKHVGQTRLDKWWFRTSGRGTFDIFWSCISTLALSVWTAVHPNILCVSTSSRSLLSRTGMMIVTIVSPEIILSTAWRQLRSSGWLLERVNSLDSCGLRNNS